MRFNRRTRHKPLISQLSTIWPLMIPAILVITFIVLVGAFFFMRGQTIMQQQLRERLRSTAASAVMQFDPDVIEEIITNPMRKKAALNDTVMRLQHLRESVPNIKFAYIMRRVSESDPANLEFVADADLALNDVQLDRNHNGSVDEDEVPGQPGDAYDASDYPALKYEAFLHPTVDEDITVDQWGSLVSGYAPIQKNGHTVAVLGIDMSADEYVELSQSIFSPIAMLLVVTAALTIGASLILFLFSRRLESLHSLDMERSGLLRLAFHQIGQPLAIINWSLELLKEQVTAKDAAGILVNMEEGVTRLQQILYTLRDADLIHAGKMRYDARAASLNETIHEIAAETKRRLDQRKQSLKVTLSDDVQMELDKKLIGSVLRELLNNAIDYSPVGSTIAISTTRRVRDVLVEVEDHGCGIPLADRDRIFGEFVRGSNAYIYRADGSGLGLYIIQGIIRKAGGNIWFTSTLGKGSTFSFTLPLA